MSGLRSGHAWVVCASMGVALACGGGVNAGPSSAAPARFVLEPGDLLFQDLDCGPLCDAIERVTAGVNGASFSHVAMVSQVQGDSVRVIEAMGKTVREVPLEAFLERSRDDAGNPKVLVGRLRAASPGEAVENARGLLGEKYDDAFLLGDDAYYCAELVYEAVRRDGKRVFEPAPMTFVDPATGGTFPAWVAYYEDLRREVPEGEPGVNPGALSRSAEIRIVHAYGRPAGWRGP